MNSLKKDSGWILCPSKSFPGKFYYFNVRNGEAVWGSNDIDNKSARKDSGHKIADKSHCYPEPSSPPLDEYPNTSNIGPNKPIFTSQSLFNISIPNEISNTNIGCNTPTTQPFPPPKTFINVRRTILNQQKMPYNTENLYQNFVQPSPQFNQAIFPKYISNVDPYMQNVIWTPIQMPRPMFMANTPIKMEMFDQNTSMCEDRDNFVVQSCNIPLTKRFINFEENLHRNNEQSETMTNTQMFDPTDTNMRESSETNVQMFEPINKAIFQPIKRLRTQSESDRSVIFKDFEEKSKDTSFQIKTLCPARKTLFTKPLFEKVESSNIVNGESVIKNPKFLERNDSGSKSTLLPSDKTQNKNDDLLDSLDKSDLRFLLMAKRRRSFDLGGLSNNVEEKKTKTSACSWEPFAKVAAKKRVTFHITDPNDVSSEELQEESVEKDSQEIDLNPPMNPLESEHTIYWYIVPDTDAMLEDFQQLDRLVQSDENCRLMLPHVVHTEIENVCRGDCHGQRRQIAARMLLRRLATLPRHVLCETPETKEFLNKSTMDRIVHCCLRLKENNHVILITNDNKLRKKGNLNNIHVYKLQDIKDGVVTAEMLKIEYAKYMKIQITLNNDTNPNLFLQNINEFNPFPLNKDAIYVNTYRIPLFEATDVTDKHTDMRDAITSPINLTDEENSVDDNNNGSDTNDIGVNMQKLVIKENIFNAKNQDQRIIFGHERELVNKNTVNLQSKDIKKSMLTKAVDNVKSYQKISTKENESKHEDSITQNQRTNDNKGTTNKGNKILINRTLRSKIDKSNEHVNKKTNETNATKGSNVNITNGEDRLQVKNSLINRALRSEMQEFNVNTKSKNIKIQDRYNEESEDMNIESINASLYENIKLLKNRLTKKVVRPIIDRQNVTNNLDSKLKKFQVRNELMSETIKFKIEEFICTYTQIMEEVLSRLLQESKLITNSLTPPWTLHEALTCVKKMYDNTEVRMYADELTLLILNNCCKRGKLQRSVKPNDFMRIVGLGSLLLDSLKTLQPHSQDLSEAQQLLNVLCENIWSPTDVDNIDPTPPTRSDDDDLSPTRRKYFVKKPADVVKWLKDHFPQWKNYEEQNDTTHNKAVSQQNDMKIVRTSGRNINLLTINNTKSMTLNRPIDNQNEECAGAKTMRPNEQIKQINNENKTDTVNTNPDKPENKNAEPKIIRLFATSTPKAVKITENELQMPTHGNTFNDDNSDGPKVIRNLKLIDTFEEKLKAKTQDCTKINETCSTFTFNNSPCTINDDITNNESQDMSIDFMNDNTFSEYAQNNDIFTQKNDTFAQNNDTFAANNDASAENNDSFAQINIMTNNDDIINEFIQMNGAISNSGNILGADDTTDSGFENDNTQMYTVLRIFLCKLSVSLKMIYKFIDESVLVFRDEKVERNKLKSLQDKATLTHEHLAGIIYKLKCIIHRESGEHTVLKNMLITSGLLTADKRMTRYRHVVTKCLEQAQMLENALNMMLTIADGDLDTSLYTHVPSPVYFNIFE